MNPTLDEMLAQVPPEVLMDLMQQLVEDSMARVKRGEMPDLQPIERGVTAMCERIVAMKREEAEKFKPPLALLMAQLGEVAEVLKKHQEAGTPLAAPQANLYKKADHAYRTTLHVSGKSMLQGEEE